MFFHYMSFDMKINNKSQQDIIKHACNEGESRVVIETGNFNIESELSISTRTFFEQL